VGSIRGADSGINALLFVRHSDRSGVKTVTGRYNQFNESEQLAQILQWDPDKIGSYEGGEKTIEPDRLLRIAKALGLQLFNFIHRPDGPRLGARKDEQQPSGGGGSCPTLIEEGLALNRAFFNIKPAPLRKAIIALAVEYAKMDTAD
jgi:hypothetical protein